MKLALLIASAVMLSLSAFAKTQITEDGAYIYITTPFCDLRTQERRILIERSISYLIKTLKHNIAQVAQDTHLPINPMVLEMAQSQVSQLTKQLEWYVNTSGIPGAGIRDLAPTALLVHFGMGTAGNFGIANGGGSIYVGLVLLPVQTTVIDKATSRVVVTTYTARWAPVYYVNLNVGIGADDGPDIGIGAGFAWGQLDEPEDFVGVAGAASGALGFLAGTSWKVGILKEQGAASRYNPFVFVTYHFGGVKLAAHGVFKLVRPLDALWDAVLGSNHTMELGKQVPQQGTQMQLPPDLLKELSR